MASLQAQGLLSSSFIPCHGRWRASLHAPLSPKNKPLSTLPNLQSLIPFQEQILLREQIIKRNKLSHKKEEDNNLITTKLLVIAETAADRAEMHAIIGEQRNNWNHLFLHSINSITLTASLMAAIASTETSLPLNLSSAVLFTSAAGLMLLVNKIQPSQLAEEQRNAARLFKQLERSIHTTLSLSATLTESDVEEAMEKVLALQKAYPLPLLPGMLEKFPKVVEPTKWWPKQRQPRRKQAVARMNGWTHEMEEEMRGVLRVLKAKDEEQYVRLGQLVLNINKFLSFAGPLLSGVAAAGAAASIGGGGCGSLPAVVGGALAAVVNTVEHGGQVGMVFELFRNCAGFYRRLEEDIEFNLGEEEEEMREQGEVFEVKMALQLGRSLSELRTMASYSSPSSEHEEIKEFAGKLF